jgi:hypothetical protein
LIIFKLYIKKTHNLFQTHVSTKNDRICNTN